MLSQASSVPAYACLHTPGALKPPARRTREQREERARPCGKPSPTQLPLHKLGSVLHCELESKWRTPPKPCELMQLRAHVAKRILTFYPVCRTRKNAALMRSRCQGARRRPIVRRCVCARPRKGQYTGRHKFLLLSSSFFSFDANDWAACSAPWTFLFLCCVDRTGPKKYRRSFASGAENAAGLAGRQYGLSGFPCERSWEAL